MIKLDQNIKHIHCLGVGGVGVSAIAQLLHARGFKVSGSDLLSNKYTKQLQQLGVNVFASHAASNVGDADLIVYSSAIKATNPEMQRASAHNIPCVRRGDMLALLMQTHQGIAVVGTHGKTTTTGFIAHTLATAELDPSFMIGGTLQGYSAHGYHGAGELFVTESDESDASFLKLKPRYAIITNLDEDHLETYDHDLNKLKQAVVQFLNSLPPDGLAIINKDDAILNALLPQLNCAYVTFGFSETADYKLDQFKVAGFDCDYRLTSPDHAALALQIKFPGQHNVLNSAAAAVLALRLHVDTNKIAQALLTFKGVGRRFDVLGEKIILSKRVLLIDDYGHHPQAISATISAIKSAWPQRRLVLVFQPHRYTRTRDLFKDFAKALAATDVLILLPIFAASEAPIDGISSQALLKLITAKGTNALYVEDNQLSATLEKLLQDDDVLLMQGAGSISAMAHALVEC